MLSDFRQFIARGNLVDLAVAVVIGVAFTAVVDSLVADLITPLIAALFGEPDFSGLSFAVNGSEFRYGNFINALLSFVIIAAVVFFVVKPVNALLKRLQDEPTDETVRKCPEASARSRYNLDLDLEVHVSGRSPYRVANQYIVPASAQLGPGVRLPVKVDPNDQAKIAIDWDQVGTGPARGEVRPAAARSSRAASPPRATATRWPSWSGSRS